MAERKTKPEATAKPRAKATVCKSGACRRATTTQIDLRALGARVVSVFGPFDSRALIELPTAAAESLFSDPLAECGRTNVADSVARDLEEIKTRMPALAESALAATALALALQLDHPYNSATSKSMCAKALMDAIGQLRELAPPPVKRDKLDELTDRRERRRSGLADGKPRATPKSRS